MRNLRLGEVKQTSQSLSTELKRRAWAQVCLQQAARRASWNPQHPLLAVHTPFSSLVLPSGPSQGLPDHLPWGGALMPAHLCQSQRNCQSHPQSHPDLQGAHLWPQFAGKGSGKGMSGGLAGDLLLQCPNPGQVSKLPPAPHTPHRKEALVRGSRTPGSGQPFGRPRIHSCYDGTQPVFSPTGRTRSRPPRERKAGTHQAEDR